MRVFDFTLLSGYEFSGVDVAQGFRARLFAKNNVNAKFIFTELPTIRDMELYGSQKIKRGQIMSAHLFMTGRLDMSLSVKKEALLENEKENYEYDNIDEDGKVIRLYNSGEKSVEILCDEDRFVINESLFKNGKKYLENYYTDSLSYTELYNWDNDSNDGLNLGRRIFWNKQGQMVYEQCIYKDNVEYLFKNGEVIDNVEFLERFVKTLNLCENDICIMDRAGYLDYIQPLFENKGNNWNSPIAIVADNKISISKDTDFYGLYQKNVTLSYESNCDASVDPMTGTVYFNAAPDGKQGDYKKNFEGNLDSSLQSNEANSFVGWVQTFPQTNCAVCGNPTKDSIIGTIDTSVNGCKCKCFYPNSGYKNKRQDGCTCCFMANDAFSIDRDTTVAARWDAYPTISAKDTYISVQEKNDFEKKLLDSAESIDNEDVTTPIVIQNKDEIKEIINGTDENVDVTVIYKTTDSYGNVTTVI